MNSPRLQPENGKARHRPRPNSSTCNLTHIFNGINALEPLSQEQNQGCIGSWRGGTERVELLEEHCSDQQESRKSLLGQHWYMQGRGWVWKTQQRVSQRDPPSWNLPAIGVFSPSEFSEHTVSHPRVCFGHVPITTVHIFSHLIYFKSLKGRRNYALFALMIFFFFALLGAGLSNLSFPDNFSSCRHFRSSW